MQAGRKGTRIYLSSITISMVWAALRYTLMARILGPHELGLAAIIIMTAQFFDMVGDTGSDRFLVQDQDGDAPRLMGTVHFIYVARGLGTCAILLLTAQFLANFYGSQELFKAFLVLSTYPLVMAFNHLDFRRLQRGHDFRPEAVVILLGETIGFAVTVAVALWRRDFYASVWGTIARAVGWVIASHLTAKRRYRIAFSKEDALRLAAFGGPLMINGLVLFFGSQGDRVVIAKQLSVSELGLYSAVILLAFYPSSMLQKFLTSTQLPVVAGAKADPAALERLLDTIAGRATLAALVMTVGFAVFTPFVLAPLYGPRFAQSATVVCLIGILQISRFARYWPTVASLGIGRSGPVLAANLSRLCGVPVAIGLVALGFGLPGLVAGFTLGELVAYVVNLVLFNRAAGYRPMKNMDRIAIYFIAAACLVPGVAFFGRSPLATAATLAGGALWVMGLWLRERRAIRGLGVVVLNAWRSRRERLVTLGARAPATKSAPP